MRFFWIKLGVIWVALFHNLNMEKQSWKFWKWRTISDKQSGEILSIAVSTWKGYISLCI